VFGISFEELIVLLVLALILFGPERLPEYAEKLGRFIAKLRQASSEVNQQIQTQFLQPPPPYQQAYGDLPCPRCGKMLNRDFLFCPNCGHRLSEAQEKPPEPEKPPTLAS